MLAEQICKNGLKKNSWRTDFISDMLHVCLLVKVSPQTMPVELINHIRSGVMCRDHTV